MVIHELALIGVYAPVVQLSDLLEINCLLITQSLDRHCHLKTLKPFSQKSPNVRVIATPNAKKLLGPLFRNVSMHSLQFFCWDGENSSMYV